MRSSLARFAAALALLSLSALCGAAEQITVESLLREILDRDAAARFPEPAYKCFQHSSYDRATKTPDDPKGWFANNDQSQFIRVEQRAGHKEEVMFDADGPGAIVRFWITMDKSCGTVRLYIDDMENPAFEGEADQMAGGPVFAGKPWSEERARGRNMYLPIPYAKHAKMTFQRTKGGPFYYHVNFRTYAAGTPVESCSKTVLERAKTLIEETGRKLLDDEASLKEGKDQQVQIAGTDEGKARLSGPAAIRKIAVKVEAEDLREALRATVLKLTFDGETTVECPVGDFFGSGVGVHAYQTWWNKVDKDGTLACYWIMPFAKNAEVALQYRGTQKDVKATLSCRSGEWKWDERSMLFHDTRRMVPELDTAKKSDFNFMIAEGQGVYMGDVLMVANPVRDWWGEGDEKVFVDGETFPSHIGTGTEDYYGYAWCTPQYFTSPFHAQPYAQGPGNAGHTTNTRVRMLDGIPFTKSLKFDIECWHWKACKITYASCAWWYARPGAKGNHPLDPQTLIVTLPEGPAPNKIKGALEAEDMKVVKKTGGEAQKQADGGWGMSGEGQLWWTHPKAGDELVLAFQAKKAGKYKVVGNFCHARDYGKAKVAINGTESPKGELDFFLADGVQCRALELGEFDVKEGENTLTITCTGTNDKAEPKSHMIGLDYLLLKE
jgi:hypothetical protein